MFQQLDQFHKTRLGYLLFAIAELAITYGFASLSIDRGNLWWYLLALIFLIGSLQNFVRLIGRFSHGEKSHR